MKKATSNKLNLNASTVRQLTSAQLGSVNGGLSGERCVDVTDFCSPSLYNTACNSCVFTINPTYCAC